MKHFNLLNAPLAYLIRVMKTIKAQDKFYVQQQQRRKIRPAAKV